MESMQAPDLVGQVLDGRYRVEALLGSGGMGAVYRATHVNMEQRVAIKVLKPHLARDPVAAKRLAREARGTFKLETEHAVKVHDFGATEAGLVYLVMELLDGRTVGDELEVDGAFAPARAVRIAAQLCDALAAAHKLGFIHRDIKPDNVMLVRRGADADFVKVLDFGLAKLIEGAGGNLFSVAALTQNDMVFGTPEYMAPEQAMGHPLDAKADLYAVGATLFEMLTGRTPFVEASPMKLLAAHVRQAPPKLRDVRREIANPALEDVMARCLAKAPEQRPWSAADLAAELRALAPGLPERAGRVAAAVAQKATVDVNAVLPPSAPSAPMTVSTRGIRTSTRLTIAAVVGIAVVFAVVVVLAMTREKEKAPAKEKPPTHPPPLASVSDSRSPPPDAAAALVPVDAAVVARSPDAGTGRKPKETKDEIDPEYEKHLKAAEAGRRSGNRLKQLAEAQAALKIDPKATRARFLMGEALLETGDVGNGCKYLRQAKRLREAKAILTSGRCPAD
jgi:serine/threonine-protein kinase